MDDIETFKRFLGPVAVDYTDTELRQLHQELHSMAELLLDIYVYKKRGRAVERSVKKDFDTCDSAP